MTPNKIYLSKLVMAGEEILDKPVSDSDVEYIRADVIRNEIERLMDEYNPVVGGVDETTGAHIALAKLILFLSTLESEKPVPNDLEEAADKYEQEYSDDETLGMAFIAGAKWQKEQDEEEQADLFTIVALDAAQRAKEQMMKDGLDAVKTLDFNKIEKTIAGVFVKYGMDRQKEQMMEEFPKWRKIKAGERLPCPAYVWTIAYDNYPDCFEGRLMPNIQGVKVGRDTWYLPVDVIHNLPKED